MYCKEPVFGICGAFMGNCPATVQSIPVLEVSDSSYKPYNHIKVRAKDKGNGKKIELIVSLYPQLKVFNHIILTRIYGQHKT